MHIYEHESMSSGEMCSFFYHSMEAASTVQGDLTDIVRGGSRSGAAPSGFLASTGIDPRGSDQLLELSANGCLSSSRLITPAPAVPVVPAPRAPGVKRRKGQAKRVICIPAPASSAEQEGSNKSSTSGVIVPSDLWAWRKYGQKPIKGSPYPRGYYRCSSSKGCSARKQVERSRSDPNMLVITYTSEHNHPWPTHRNSLAGSTRSSSLSSSHPSKNQKNSNQPSPSSSKQEADHGLSMLASTPPTEAIKEENLDFDQVFDQSYAPMMLESKDMELFDELGLDPDPMSFFFSSRELKLEEEGESNRGLDQLSYFDNWDGN